MTAPLATHRKLVDEHPLLVLPSLATAIGLNEAVFLQQLHFLLQTSTHEHDGRKWVYNTYEQWQTVFPFWKPRLLRSLLTDLERSKLLIAGNYNQSKADRTKWYSIDYEQLSHVTESVSPTDEICQSMCQKTAVHVTESVDSDQRLSAEKKKESVYSSGFLLFWQHYPVKKAKGDAWRSWQRQHLEPLVHTIVASIREHQEGDDQWRQGFIKHPATYLNDRCWEDELASSQPRTPHKGKLSL